jgi:hypothetical protein
VATAARSLSDGQVTASRRSDVLAVALLLAVPTLFFLDVLLGSGVFYLGDVPFYHFPGKKILRDIVLGGELPYWNPFFSAGQPLAANPAHEVFYPLTWLILLPSFVYGFQLLALLHVYLAALSTYALLRSLGTARAAAVAGGLSFALGGFVLSGLQLFPFLFSAAWMPLTCLFTRRFLLHRMPRDFALASAAFGMQLLIGEPVTILQTGFLLGLYALFRERRLRNLACVAAISVAALLVSAVQTLPMLDHYRDSVRARGLSYADVVDGSAPPIRFAEVVYPSLFGEARNDSPNPYWGTRLFGRRGTPFFLSIYSGLLIAAMAFAGVAAGIRGRWLYVTVCASSILLSLGSHTPLFRWLYDVGLLRSIRFPEKFAIMGIFATVIFGTLTFDAVLRGEPRARKIAASFAAATALGAIVAWLLTPALFTALWHVSPDGKLAFARHGWTMAAARGLLLAAILFALPHLRRGLGVALALTFVIADLGMFVPQLAPRAPVEFYTEPPPVVQDLAPNRDDYRIFQIHEWTPNAGNKQPYLKRGPQLFLLLRNALTGLSPATYGLRGALEVDYDLTSLTVTADFAKAAWELRDRSKDWLNSVAAMSNIRYVALYQPMDRELARTGGDARAMRPTRFIEGLQNPRYYFAPQTVTARSVHEFTEAVASGRYPHRTAYIGAPAFTPAPGQVLRSSETANSVQLVVEAAGDAFLVMSVTAHKYWRVTIDGHEVPAIPTNIAYQGVLVPRGRHVVEMRYRNPLIAAGGGVSIAALVALLFAGRRRNGADRMRAL